MKHKTDSVKLQKVVGRQPTSLRLIQNTWSYSWLYYYIDVCSRNFFSQEYEDVGRDYSLGIFELENSDSLTLVSTPE